MNTKEEVLVFLRSINTDRAKDLGAFVARHQEGSEMLEKETWEHLRNITHHLTRIDSLRTYFGVGVAKRKRRVLVTGGTKYADKEYVWETLGDINDAWGDIFIIQGGAVGVDEHARFWAMDRHLPFCTVPVHRKMGNLSVPKSNSWMIELEPDLCVSFPGGNGTANCVKQAQAAFIPHYDAGER